MNIGMLLRLAEIYQRQVFVTDSYKVFNNDTSVRKISDLAVGALQRRPIEFVSDIIELRAKGSIGRFLATDSVSHSSNPFVFEWQADDCIALGNELDGISAELIQTADATLKIPMPSIYHPKPASYEPIDPKRSAPVSNEGAPSLNVATAGAVLICTAFNQLGR